MLSSTDVFREKMMKIQYFSDTVYIELTKKEVVETKDINENAVVDFDVDGNLVAITLEHAKERADIFDFSFQQVLAEPQMIVS